ncbi:MAG: twin-arginine translocase TatA/TatE family subunit [Planctomycetota bacterium]
MESLLDFTLLPIGFFSGFGYTEMFLFGIIALMLFGSRLPHVARNFGRTYKQLRGKVDEFQREFRDWDKEDSTPSYGQPRFSPEDDHASQASPKFLPPPAEEEDEPSGPRAPKFDASQLEDD